MKRALHFVAVTAFILSLSGCTVNGFGRTYDVPWYFVVIPILIVFLIANKRIMSDTYVCSHCGGEIKLKWYQIYAYLHMNNKRFMICPHCKKSSFCKRK